ncbi:hypothetical protein Tco_0549666 [Tanacetum coccineum]
MLQQDKYVAEILKKFDFVAMVKTASTPIETNRRPLGQDEEANFHGHSKDFPSNAVKRILYLVPKEANPNYWEIHNRRLSISCRRPPQLLAMQEATNVATSTTRQKIDTLPNQAILSIQQMGYEGEFNSININKALFHAPNGRKPSETLPTPSPAPTSEVPYEPQTDSFLAHTSEVSDQAKEIQALKAKITKLKKQAKPRRCKRESSFKRDPLFDVMPEDTIDHMETENAQSEGRTREMVDEDKEIDEVRLSTEDVVSTDKESTEEPNEGTDENLEGTEEQREGTEEKVESTDGQIKGTEDQTEEEIATQATQTSTQTPTSMIFGDDETIAKVLLNMSSAKAASKEKEKGVELKDVEDTDRPRPTSTRSLLTLKPLPKIDPKTQKKKKLARKVQEEWEEEEERNRVAEEQAANEELIKDFDDIKARIEADRLLAEKLQEQEREQFTIEERAKFLHDTIAAQRKFLAQQRSEAIRNKPPTKNQLRNQMMTYLKHVGNYKHAELKIKKFEEVQALYEKIKRSDEDFISIGSAEDERLIKRMNEKGVDLSKSEVIKEESKDEVKEEDKDEESTRKRKLGTRKKMKSRKRRYIQNTSEDDSDKENDELRLHLTIVPDEEKEVDYEILDRKYPIKEWKTECFGTKPQTDQTEHLEEINLNVVIRSNGQKRHFSTLMSVLSIFDREDLDAVNQLVMDRFQDEMPEGFDRVLWGDLMVLFNSDDKDEFWGSQQDWKIESWKLHSSSGVHTLVTDTGLVIHMLVEKKYPLRKEVLKQMLKLKQREEEEERNRVAEEQAANEALIRNFDDIKARIEADRLLAEKLQEQEREQFTIEERAKFLHDTIAAQRRFLAQQRSEAIRNKPPTKNQLRNQMMTYLKHVGNFKHAELKIKKFEEVQALYEKIKRSDEDFISIGSAEDERLIKKMNEKGVDSSKDEMIKEESKEEVQEESKEEESKKKRKLGTRKKMKSRKRRYIQNTSEDDSDKENDELRLYLTIAPDEEKEVDYEILDRKYPIKEWKTESLGTKPQTDQAEHLEEINLNVVIRSNG